MIKDKVAVLGANDGKVKLFAPDGFTTQQTIDEAPSEATPGMFLTASPVFQSTSSRARAPSSLRHSSRRLGGKEIDPYAIYGAQAAQVMLDAIAASDGGSRADVIAKMFADEGHGRLPRIVFGINENGEPERRRGRSRRLHDLQGHGPSSKTVKTISPKPEDVEAATRLILCARGASAAADAPRA